MMENQKSEKQDKEIKISYSEVLNFDPTKIPIPECMGGWDKENPQSKEYGDMMEELGILARYISMRLATGPEVKDNVTKRCASFAIILNEIVINTSLDGWHVYGVLSELQNNIYMSISGRMKTIELLKMISLRSQQKVKEKMGSAIV